MNIPLVLSARTRVSGIGKSILKQGFSYAQSRLIHSSAKELAKPAYGESGKTTVSILNKEFDGGFLIDSFSQYGFRLNNGITVVGSMVSFARTILSWKVEDPRHINEASLRLFTILEPKPDVVVIGVGDDLNLESKVHFSEGVHNQIMKIGRAMKLSLEIMPTQQAAGTYNFLISEGRHVAGAMIPPKHIILTQNDIIRDKAVRETAVRPAIPGF